MVVRNHVKEIKYKSHFTSHFGDFNTRVMEILLQQLHAFTAITNVRIKEYLLFKVTPSTNILSRNNKVKLRGWCATDNTEPVTLIRTIFLALKYIYKSFDKKHKVDRT